MPSWTPLVWWVAMAAALAAVVVALVRPPGPLDQPDPARQRDGLLLDGPTLPATLAGVGFGDRPALLLFDRRPPDRQRLETWLSGVPDQAQVHLVLPEAPDPGFGTGLVDVVVDPGGRLAVAVDLPVPVDGGRGIGYAVLDHRRQVRYSTLDRAYLDNAFEVATILEWVS